MSNITKDLDTLEEELDSLAPTTESVRVDKNLRLKEPQIRLDDIAEPVLHVAADKIVGYEPPQRREEMPLDLSGGGDYENIYYIRKENTVILDNYNLVGCFSMPDRFEAECGSYDITDDDADNGGSQRLDFTACKNACSARRDCVGFSHDGNDDCWLKKQYGIKQMYNDTTGETRYFMKRRFDYKCIEENSERNDCFHMFMPMSSHDTYLKAEAGKLCTYDDPVIGTFEIGECSGNYTDYGGIKCCQNDSIY